MTHLSDLSPGQIRLMAKLDDGFDHIDSVGREIGALHLVEVMDAGVLSRMALVTADQGRGGQVWVRLTEKGRKVREEGKA